MRIISDDGMVDIPYEGTVLSTRSVKGYEPTNKLVAFHGMSGVIEVEEYRTRQRGIVMAEYSNPGQAAEALRYIRKSYEMGMEVCKLADF